MAIRWAICCSGLSMQQGDSIGALLLRWEARRGEGQHRRRGRCALSLMERQPTISFYGVLLNDAALIGALSASPLTTGECRSVHSVFLRHSSGFRRANRHA